jgi:hypothetical protein
VQYGLQSLLDGHIEAEEFLRVNTFVGGWKDQSEMVQETCPYYPEPGCFIGTDIPTEFDPWSIRLDITVTKPIHSITGVESSGSSGVSGVSAPGYTPYFFPDPAIYLPVNSEGAL